MHIRAKSHFICFLACPFVFKGSDYSAIRIKTVTVALNSEKLRHI